MITCPGCGTATAAGQKFCGGCGSPISEAPPAAEAVEDKLRQKVLFVAPAAATEGRAGKALKKAVGAKLLGVDPGRAVAAVQAALGKKPGRYEAVCLLGDDRDLPHARVRDRTGNDDAVLTDNLFGMTSTPSESDRYEGALLPEVPVTRIPSLDADLVRQVVSVRKGRLLASWKRGLAVSAKVWKGASQAVLQRIAGGAAPSLHLSPAFSSGSAKECMGTRLQRLYFNVHGTDQAAVWVGEGGGKHPVVMRPDVIEVASGAVCVSEACYGAITFDDEDSISLRFLERGVGCFVGSTIIAWGPTGAPPSLADLIVTGVYEALDAGEPAGFALLKAKQVILDKSLSRGEALSPSTHNTLMSFVAYGNPLATVKGTKRPKAAPLPPGIGARPPGPRARAKPAGPGGSGSVLDQIRARMAGAGVGAPGGGSALDGVRQRLQQRLPPGSWRVLSSGRVQLSQLATRFRNYAEISQSLTDLLGAPPEETDVTSYQSSGQERSCITASSGKGLEVRRALLVVDGAGEILETAVAR